MKKVKFDLVGNFPEFEELLTSKQYELAQELIRKRIKLGLSFEEISNLVGYSPQEYIDFEYADKNIEISKFEEVIYKLNKYEEHNFSVGFEKNTDYITLNEKKYSYKPKEMSKKFKINEMDLVA
ncbi:hypothetical protein [Fundicoccus culcitae]|uniref:HTH cro/C1-type domain-containing protein n=1 Tax=Fundicoccus culcitae TaxID=2969821 RepID=A0ABY5P9R5_9LACT|nr:hypothetical protein [Fundicoccus culcitae]UUX35195.1 hypothetical protein NRE15_06010 [Fundicoccus culcitae]